MTLIHRRTDQYGAALLAAFVMVACAAAESAKVVVDLPQLPKTVTILKPAVESSFSEKKGRLNTLKDQDRKKVGLALMFLGALAEEGS